VDDKANLAAQDIGEGDTSAAEVADDGKDGEITSCEEGVETDPVGAANEVENVVIDATSALTEAVDEKVAGKPLHLAEPAVLPSPLASLKLPGSHRLPAGHQLPGSSSSTSAPLMQASSADMPGDGLEGQAKASNTDSDIATPEMLRKLSTLMDRRAKIAMDGVVQTLRERLPTAIAPRPGGSASGAPARRQGKQSEDSEEGALKSIFADTNSIIDQLQRSEKSASKELKRMSDPEVIKQSNAQKPVRDAIEKELAKWREGVLSKAVLKAVEGKAFSEKFSEGLLATTNTEVAGLTSVLAPNPSQLQESFKADFRQWCGKFISKDIQCGLLEERDLRASKSAFDSAMREVSLQTIGTFSKFLEENNAAEKMSQFTQLCSEEVVGVVRQEVNNYRQSQARQPQTGSSAGGAPATVVESFARRMRTAVAPLTEDLDQAAKGIALAGATLERCMVAAGECETASPGTTNTSLPDPREAMIADLVAGRLKAALERALTSNLSSLGQETSLVELFCDHLQNPNDENLAEIPRPEEVLVAPRVASQLDGRLQARLMFALVERSASEKVASVARIEINLEWVIGLLQTAPQETDLVAFLETSRNPMAVCLENLVRGSAPVKLADAPTDVTRRVSRSARMASKELSMLLATRPA